MLVGVDTVHRGESPVAGPEDHYLARVLGTVRRIQSNTRFVIFTHKGNHGAFEGWMRVRVPAPPRGFSLRASGARALERAARKAGVDLLFAPLESAHDLPRFPVVLYALSLGAWEGATERAEIEGVPTIRACKRACGQARAMVVSSEHLRHRCLDLFEAPIDRTVVAAPGVDPVFDEAHRSMVPTPYTAIYYDRLTAPDIRGVIRAFEDRPDDLPQTLAVVGPRSPGEPEDWGGNVVRIEHCPAAALAGIYRYSSVFVYPARHDGSALRILEALCAGACVVTPRSGGVEELAGNAPIYYNPESTGSLVQAVRRALSLSAADRATRIHAGQVTAAAHTWDKTAWKVLSAFKRV